MSTSAFDVAVIGAGQSGLAAAHALRGAGLRPLVLEAGLRAAGSWPAYYDSLTLFSPARYSALPGLAFDGDPDRYPHRDEVTAYLERYAARLDAEIRTGARVRQVRADGGGFTVELADGTALPAPAVIAASGSFGNPYLPALPGREGFTGEILHAAAYRAPAPYAGRRIVVVGAGNSAVQIAHDLADTATVTLATRAPIRFVDQRPLGRDLHFWFTVTGLDRLPARLVGSPPGVPVLDDGRYRRALASGRMERKEMFTGFADEGVVWADGSREHVDVVIFATGYRPHLPYLDGLDALDETGRPRQRGGLSVSRPGLAFLGLEWQRSPSSNTLRGVGRDAAYLVRHLSRRLRIRRGGRSRARV
ncbi:NAD(P)/FAD-dependent oxidoreductase [Planomonospora sp. ID67723]|uniref:flavin-containing monooxygenase n=1 Tax=Planomonospora sp. ID67723 TaxID=2738134 RepID=UPI0018C3BEB3|nr:NAD(P)/FAD-dependent oxidoreductase [Planomonospora sp. ID67723]MBG0831381.1 NAD(P)/FAD-dependent oxidoreductase [Planomonospora sp. ID67723]